MRLFSIFVGRNTHHSPKGLYEIRVVIIAQALCNGCDFFTGRSQKIFCPFHPQPKDIIRKLFSRLFMEQSGQIGRIQKHLAGNRLAVLVSFQVLADILFDAVNQTVLQLLWYQLRLILIGIQKLF